MADLRDALFKAGLVSERVFRESEAQAQLDAEEETRKRVKSAVEKERRIQILSEATSPELFRREARKLLLNDPSLVQHIIDFAHERGLNHKDNKPGRRLIANLYAVRGLVAKVTTLEAQVKIVEVELPNK